MPSFCPCVSLQWLVVAQLHISLCAHHCALCPLFADNANALGLFLVKIVLSDNWSTAFIVLTLVTSTGAACIGILWVALWLIEAAAKRKEAKVRAAKATIIGATLVEEEDGGDDDDDEPFSLWSALRESIWGAITTLWLHRTLRHLLPTVFMYGFTRGIVSR